MAVAITVRLSFAGSQTLGGSGTVVFGNSSGYPYYVGNGANALWLATGGTTLTIGPGITVHGSIGDGRRCLATVTVEWTGQCGGNQPGTISADVSGGTITVNAQPFTNQGLAQSGQRRHAFADRHMEQQRDACGKLGGRA